jgi:hypothetical protein
MRSIKRLMVVMMVGSVVVRRWWMGMVNVPALWGR